MRRCAAAVALVVTGCGGAGQHGPTTPLRPACAAGERWDGHACVARGGQAELDAATTAFTTAEIGDAVAALDRAAQHPLDHASYLRLWETRGMVRAATDDQAGAREAFARVLDVDPGHAIDCDQGPTLVHPFQAVRADAAARRTPELELRWRRDLRLGEPVPIEIENIADPAGLLHGLTVYVRTRGEPAWRAADVALPGPGGLRTLVLPPVAGTRSTALELYAVAEDDRGDEIHLWASPERPREVPLRFDPPTPWYRKWWVWAAVGGAAAVGTGVVVYATVWEPSATLDATVSGAR